jgi:hypothetical protein
MDPHDLLYSIHLNGDSTLLMSTFFFGISASVIAAAFVAGGKLTRLLALGIVCIYGVYASVMTLSLVSFFAQRKALIQDFRDAAEAAGLHDLNIVQHFDGSGGAYGSFAIVIYAAVACAVVFFVMYAMFRYGPGDQIAD